MGYFLKITEKIQWSQVVLIKLRLNYVETINSPQILDDSHMEFVPLTPKVLYGSNAAIFHEMMSQQHASVQQLCQKCTTLNSPLKGRVDKENFPDGQVQTLITSYGLLAAQQCMSSLLSNSSVGYWQTLKRVTKRFLLSKSWRGASK